MKHRKLIIIFSVVALPIIAYALTSLVVAFLSLDATMMLLFLISIAIWMILLTIPYLILKVVFRKTALERDLHIKDLPDEQPKTKIKYPEKTRTSN